VKVVDIGIDVDGVGDGPPSWVVDARDLALPVRGAQDHKWSSAVYVVGGSVGMLGAPLMAARAAQRAGAGMVVCGVPGAEAAARASADEVVLRALPASVLGALQENAATAVLEQASRFRCVAIGPGLGQDAGARAAVRRIVAECPVPLVIDADALNALAADPAALRVRHAAGLPIPILTPHAGEYERLAGRPVGPDRIAAARTLAGQLRAVVLLKGPGTVVADPDGGVWINRTDGAALAAAGTGDVLTGIIAAIVAHGVTPAAAASTAAYVHGRAATVAGTGSGLVATDVTAALPRTLDGLRTGADPWED
jgi:NAD(P)H-hydrate epimerase